MSLPAVVADAGVKHVECDNPHGEIRASLELTHTHLTRNAFMSPHSYTAQASATFCTHIDAGLQRNLLHLCTNMSSA